mgnify:CR=1 FL=1
MESLVLVTCLIVVFILVGGLHLYTMKKIDSVQMTLLRGSKEWKELDNASMACVYTFLMLFLFSIAVGVILHKFVMVVLYQMYLYAVFNWGVKMYLLLDYVLEGDMILNIEDFGSAMFEELAFENLFITPKLQRDINPHLNFGSRNELSDICNE